ncbi:MAG TPA: type II toxin-antitoxin system RelE/ParE family toxin [Patescibacteria group bacterium]|nr:type II toxin-antitoxin system RelE/ParE family toxin [Patescibacteria group bacterium]
MTAPRKNSISVRISDKALKFLEKLDKPDRIKIDKAIEKIRRDPLSGKPLTGVKELRKIRAGNFRVIYAFRKTKLLILVVKIGQRQDVYKDLN